MLMPTARSEAAPVEIQLASGSGRVLANRSGTDVVVDVVLTTELNLGVTLAGAGGPVRFGVLKATNAAVNEVTTEQGWVVVQTRGPGTVTFSVSPSAADDPVRLRVSADGIPAEERWIAPARIEVRP